MLLELQAIAAAVESTGQAKAEAQVGGAKKWFCLSFWNVHHTHVYLHVVISL